MTGIPGARFLVILREPCRRAWSAWLNRVRHGTETLPFPDALRANERRLAEGPDFSGPDGPRIWCEGQIPLARYHNLVVTSRDHRTYLDVGYYALQLRRYFDLFPRDRFLILFFEDLCRNPSATGARICEFLGIDPDKAPVMPHKNQTSAFRLKPDQERLVMPWWVRLTGLRRHAFSYEHRVPRRTKEWLNAHYVPHRRELTTLLECPLDGWTAET